MLPHESEDLSFTLQNPQKKLGASHNVGEAEIAGPLGLSGCQTTQARL